MLTITKAEKSRTALCSVRELNKGMKERATLCHDLQPIFPSGPTN